jgi:hypothetical protein
MTKFHSVTIGASIVLGCLILGFTLNSPASGQGPPAPGKYQMMAAGDHGEIRVVLCNPVTGECWSKSTSAPSSAGWHYMSSPDFKPKAQPAGEIQPQEAPAKK